MSNISFEIENGVGKITLNRPDKFNSFVRQMALDLQARLDECEANSDVRTIYITGIGKAFCAGQDLAEAIDPNQTELNKNRRLSNACLFRLFSYFNRMDK